MKIIRAIRQTNFECQRHPFLALCNQVINKAVDIVGIVASGMDHRICRLDEKMPPRDSSGGAQSYGHRGIRNIKYNGKDNTHGVHQELRCCIPIDGKCELQQLNARDTVHIYRAVFGLYSSNNICPKS